MLKNRQVIAAAIQTDSTTPATPTGADAILVKNIGHSWEGSRMYDREVVKRTLGKLKPLFGGTLIAITFEVEIKGSGTAGTAPEFGPLLRACSMDETIVASTSVTYTPLSEAREYVTIYHWEDGLLYKIENAQGMVDFNLKVGQPGIMSFTFVGHLNGQAPIDTALPTPTYDSTVPSVALSVPFTVDSYAASISALSFSMGNELGKPDAIQAADGYGTIQVVDRKPEGSFDPLAVLVATYDWVGKWNSGAAVALTTGAIGATAGNIWQVDMPAVTYKEPSTGDREKVLSREIPMAICESTGDDEISLAFT